MKVFSGRCRISLHCTGSIKREGSNGGESITESCLRFVLPTKTKALSVINFITLASNPNIDTYISQMEIVPEKLSLLLENQGRYKR